ncbi:MAG TPA: amidohydrolase family protein [Candidatus Binataceae bacterium]|nr:amidohydrolase family protein [Candidatus Binataceae bacterium]
MLPERILSADSHVIEPADVWTARIDRRFRDRAPHVEKRLGDREGDFFVAEGLRPFPVAGFAVAGVNPKDFGSAMAAGYPGVRPSAWDPVERIKDQERDGVLGEVLYPSLAMRLFQLEDGELRAATFSAYNDWLADYCSHHPRRLAGVAMISLDNPGAGAAELSRVAKKGLKGAMIWGAAPDEHPYRDSRYEPFWSVAEELGTPLSLHILTEARGGGDFQVSVMRGYPALHHSVEKSLAEIIFAGVPERHPRLKFVSVENDIGWIPHFLQRLDHAYEKYRFIDAAPIPNPPSFYFRRQVWATFQDDRVGVVTRNFIGVDRLMWASDFPHSDSTWPNSREVIARDFEGVPDDEVRQVVAQNVAALYGIG